jgi:polyhydroxyalkanoate synthesis repressor PhaR
LTKQHLFAMQHLDDAYSVAEKVDKMAPQSRDQNEPIIIKKYANRRLYNTESSSYVTLDDLRVLIADNIDFIVLDAKTGEDLTRSVLTQILVEAEQADGNLLPIKFLRQLIAMYGDGMSWMMPQYLEHMTSWFEEHQNDVRKTMEGTFGSVFPVGASMDAMQEMTKRNVAAFDQAMKAFWPNAMQPQPKQQNDPKHAEGGIEELQRQMEEMQQRLKELSTKS